FQSDLSGIAAGLHGAAAGPASGVCRGEMADRSRLPRDRPGRACALDRLRRFAGDFVQVADSSAGMHILAWLPRHTHAQAQALVVRARERGLGLYLIEPYFLKASPRPGLLLGYADLPPADLQAAMRIFADCLRET